ncbi:MAG TPA: hypothetical protein VGG54_07240 [Trebonia sp.]
MSIVFGAALGIRDGKRDAVNESQARERVRKAEDNFADILRSGAVDSIAQLDPGTVTSPLETIGNQQTPGERRDDRLTLAALWDVTHKRLDLYHQIVTGQARRSFVTAQIAMTAGFILLIAFAILAALAKTSAAAISSGGLGAVAAAFAAYIGKTFVRSQESAASHLRGYFDQPLELSRYLAAERLLAGDNELTPEQRAAILGALVQSIASAGHQSTGHTKQEKLARPILRPLQVPMFSGGDDSVGQWSIFPSTLLFSSSGRVLGSRR